MKFIVIGLAMCGFVFSSSWAADKSDKIYWYNSVEASHSTTFKKNIFNTNTVSPNPGLSNIFNDNHLIIASFNYISKLSYRYLFASLLFNYTFSEDQFFDINNLLDEYTVRHEQFTLIPEIFFKWKSLAIGLGYFITFGGETPHRYVFLFNRNSPFFRIKIDQQLGKIPLYVLINFYLSPQEFNFDNSNIYSSSIGLKWYMTYYASISLIYTKNIMTSDRIDDNIGRVLFNYRFTPKFSVGVNFSQLVYTENRNPYNEISINFTYLHTFEK